MAVEGWQRRFAETDGWFAYGNKRFADRVRNTTPEQAKLRALETAERWLNESNLPEAEKRKRMDAIRQQVG